MHIIRLIPLWLACLAGNAHADNSLEIAAQLARSGAYQLAYQRVERDQPTTGTSEWPRWETLRLTLLVELQREQDALQRVTQLPPQLPASAAALYLPAARAALKQQEAALARRYLAKFLWGGQGGTATGGANGIAAGELKEARRLAIQSYLVERQPALAYLALLRYRQDYAPLPLEEIAVFGEQLVVADGVAEAANWLVQLDEGHPLNLLVRLKSGAVPPEAAIATARLAIDPPPLAPPASEKGSRKALKLAPLPPVKPAGKELAGYWTIVGMAGAQLKNAALQADSLEHRLNLASLGEEGLFGANATALWRSYEELGLATANGAHLLIGEDNRWMELAVASAAPAPLAARALFAFLVQRGGSAEIRAAAQTRLAAMLMQGDLDIAAVRLFAAVQNAEALLLANLQPGEIVRRDELFNAFGLAAAARGDYRQAAEYFLRTSGSRAKKLAAENLARAGLIDDARRLYDGRDKP